jgi:hypothetical protein
MPTFRVTEPGKQRGMMDPLEVGFNNSFRFTKSTEDGVKLFMFC